MPAMMPDPLRRSLAAALGVVVLVLYCLSAGPAGAHGARIADGPASGITIPNLTHGQMAVIARHRGEILRLAAMQIDTDETFRRLMNYANLQFAFCLWGAVPGSVADEASPFNECSHAYLAATRAVLMRMRERPGEHPVVDDLVTRIDMAMLRNHASLVLCQYSGETFDTGRMIWPDWPGVLAHPPSLAAFAGFAILLTGGIAGVGRATRPRRKY